MSRPYTEARQKSNRKYDAKTYKKMTFYLRIEDDADILESMSDAKSAGISLRGWLRDLYDNKQKE